MDSIKDIIPQVIEKISHKKAYEDGKLERIWRNILKKQELVHTKLVGIKDGSISAHVDSPAWLYQMKMRKTKILERLKTEMPDIKNISFRVGKVQ